MNIPTYAVIPFRGHHDMTASLIREVLSDQTVDRVITCCNDENFTDIVPPYYRVYAHSTANENLTQMWNIGFERAQKLAEQREAEKFNVAFLNNDIRVPGMLLHAMSGALRNDDGWWVVSSDYPATYEDPLLPGDVEQVFKTGLPREDRPAKGMCGWCFMVRGECGIFPLDEQFEWFCGDDEVVAQCYDRGGKVGILSGFHVEHAVSTTWSERPELHEIGAADMERFQAKWADKRDNHDRFHDLIEEGALSAE